MSGALAEAEAPRSPKRARLDGEGVAGEAACAVAAAPAAPADDEAQPLPFRPLLLRRHVACVPRPTPNAAQLRIAAALAAAPPGPDPRFEPGTKTNASAPAKPSVALTMRLAPWPPRRGS